MANTSTTELDLLKALTVSGGATDSLSVAGTFSASAPADVNVVGTLGALNATLIATSSGSGTSVFQIGGTWAGTIVFEGSNDSFTTTSSIIAIFLGGIQTASATATVNGYYSVLSQGFAKVQARMSAYTSGTANLVINTTSGTRVTVPLQLNAANHLVTSTQGPAGATAWKVDGSAVTQPVSIATMPSTPVTGTFFQGTQPVSIATMPSTPVTGTVTVNALPIGANLIGKVGIDQTTPGTTNAVSITNATVAVTESGTWTVQPGNTANTTPWLMKPHDGAAALYTAAAALADGVANPTEGKHAVDLFNFNGTTWDRVRNNSIGLTAIDTGTKTVTFNGATQTNYSAKGVTVTIVTSTVSGTTPTLVAQLQYSYDGGTTFVNIPGAVTTSITAAATSFLQIYPGVTAVANQSVNWALSRFWRVQYTIGGTTPSFVVNTFASYIL